MKFRLDMVKQSTLFAATLVLVSSIAAVAAPNIEFSKKTFDFGQVRQGAKVDLVYPFKNTGNETLTINDIQTSCGCTNASATSKSIPPGGSAQIKAVFNAGTFSGKITKTISVTTNDPDSASTQLTVNGVVKPSAEVYPKTVNFGTLKPGKLFKQTLIVKPLEPAKFSVETVSSPSKYISFAKPRKSASVKGAWEIPLTIDGSKAPAGRRFEMIQIKTNQSAVPMLMVRVLGNVSG